MIVFLKKGMKAIKDQKSGKKRILKKNQKIIRVWILQDKILKMETPTKHRKRKLITSQRIKRKYRTSLNFKPKFHSLHQNQCQRHPSSCSRLQQSHQPNLLWRLLNPNVAKNSCQKLLIAFLQPLLPKACRTHVPSTMNQPLTQASTRICNSSTAQSKPKKRSLLSVK